MSTYVHVTSGIIDATRGDVPGSGQRLDTGQWVSGLPVASPAVQQACGWFAVTDVAQPTPAAGNTVDRSVQVISGTPTVVWTERPMTTAEQTSTTNDTNRQTILGQIAGALSGNLTYLAISAPSNAQVVAQVRALTQQVDKMMRVIGNQLDATS